MIKQNSVLIAYLPNAGFLWPVFLFMLENMGQTKPVYNDIVESTAGRICSA